MEEGYKAIPELDAELVANYEVADEALKRAIDALERHSEKIRKESYHRYAGVGVRLLRFNLRVLLMCAEYPDHVVRLVPVPKPNAEYAVVAPAPVDNRGTLVVDSSEQSEERS